MRRRTTLLPGVGDLQHLELLAARPGAVHLEGEVIVVGHGDGLAHRDLIAGRGVGDLALERALLRVGALSGWI